MKRKKAKPQPKDLCAVQAPPTKRERNIQRAFEEGRQQGYELAYADIKRERKYVLDAQSLEVLARISNIAEAQTRMAMELSKAVAVCIQEKQR